MLGRMHVVRLERLIPAPVEGALTFDEADAVLEAVFVTLAANGEVNEAEYAAFARVAKAVHLTARAVVGGEDPYRTSADPDDSPNEPLTAEAVDARIDALVKAYERDGLDARLAEVARRLGRDRARDLAFELAVAGAVTDLSRSEDEDQTVARLRSALGISRARGDELVGHAYAVLSAGESA